MESLEARVADYLVPCTASENETCQIVTKLLTWKKLLLGSTYEIQEEAGTSNQFSVTNFNSEPQPVQNNDSRRLQQCSDILEQLLTTHRCIGSVSISFSSDHYTSLCVLRSVCKNRDIKALTIRDINASAMSTFAIILPCLTNIENLHLMTGCLDAVDYLAPVCALFQVSSSLTGLHLRGRITNQETVGALINTFLRKPTLEELSFEDLTLDRDPYLQALKQYLCSTTVLKDLSICMNNWSLQMAVLEGVFENRSIEKLSLRMFKGTEESTSLVSRIIKEKHTMRSLSIWSTDVHNFGQHSIYDCWVSPLIQNDVLEELGLCSSMLHSTKWCDFFRALPRKETLKMVHVFPTYNYSHIRWLCTELKDSGAEEKVSLEYDADLRQEAELLRCKAIWMAEFQAWQCDDRLIDAVRQLPSCQQLTTLSVSIQNDHMNLSLALAEFLRSATALRTLCLRIEDVSPQDARGQNPWWNIILESICRGQCVKYLFVEMSDMSIQDSLDFAYSVKHNTCMRDLCFVKSPKASNTAFFRRLSEGIQDNYTLASVKFEGGLEADGVRHWLAVKETTWRNSGLVARAARIKQASKSDRYVTSAVDRVSRYPSLLDEVARRAKLDRAELEVLVRDRLRGIQSMNGFMRVVGVVKERVICHPSDDGRMRLDDLNEDCWSHVRRYLVTDDVKYDTVQIDRA